MSEEIKRIKEEILRLREEVMGIRTDFADGRKSALTEVLSIIDKQTHKFKVDDVITNGRCTGIVDEIINKGYSVLFVVPTKHFSDVHFDEEDDWQVVNEEQEQPDLSSEIEYLHMRYPEVSFAKLSRIAVHVAKWQRNKFKEATAGDLEEEVLAYLESTKKERESKLPNNDTVYLLSRKYLLDICKHVADWQAKNYESFYCKNLKK